MAGNASDKEPLIFLSYTRKDIARVRNIYKRLKEAGYKPWLGLESLAVGEEVPDFTIPSLEDEKIVYSKRAMNDT